MAYEFNTQDKNFGIKHPFKIENLFLLLSAAILFGGGMAVILTARAFLEEESVKAATAAILLGLLLFGAAVKFAMQALGQIHFFFGRQFPKGLAEQLQMADTGDSPSAREIMEVLRQRAIAFPEPTGWLDGMVYSLSKQLITCPPEMQRAAVRHFHSLTGMFAVLGSLAISFFIFRGTAHEGVISWVYLPLTGVSLIAPFVQRRVSMLETNHANNVLWSLVGLVAFSIMGPVLVPRYIPALPIPPMWVVPVLVLVCSMVSSVLFLLSLFSKMDNVSQTNVSCIQTTIAMNCPPSQLWTEIEREFQNNWTRRIPNRCYANVPPDVSAGERGSFNGYILEETQPMPMDNMVFDSLGQAWQTKHGRYLILLSAWGMALSMMAVAVSVHYVPDFGVMSSVEMARILLVVVALGIANVLSLRIGHMLWSRLYFQSRLIWIEVSGTFQTSRLSVGNSFVGKSQSSSTLTRIEGATLRVWVADIVSVAFGKEADRCMMKLASADGFAQATAERLVRFAASQSSIAVPTSVGDIGRAQVMSALDASLQANSAGLAQDAFNQLAHHATPAITELEKARMAGIVKFYDAKREFGFLTGEDGVERFFNSNHLAGKSVKTGDSVIFAPGRNKRGAQAREVRLA